MDQKFVCDALHLTNCFQIHRDRFLQVGIIYIVLFLLLDVIEVRLLFTEEEVEEIKKMALFSALFYLPWMLKDNAGVEKSPNLPYD